MSKAAPNARAAALWLPVADLRPNPRNPRMHGSEVANLARTILRTAWGAPIVAQLRSKRIIGGHGRLEAAKLILRGIEVDGEMRGGAEHCFEPDAPPGCIPVRLVDVGDAEADAMTLADNARGLQGTDNAEAVVAMAAQFGRESAAMADIGFDAATLDAMVRSAGDAVLGAGSAPRDGIVAGDAATEWEGMPEFEQKDKTAFRSLAVHFKDQASVDEFAELLAQKITERTRFVWFPEIEIESYADKRYLSSES